jgi:hypothetical protein
MLGSERHHCVADAAGEVERPPKPISSGPAITSCYETSDGRFIVSNDEYASQVNFCPFCGTSAPRRRDDYEDYGPTQPGLTGPCCEDPCVVQQSGKTYCTNCQAEP